MSCGIRCAIKKFNMNQLKSVHKLKNKKVITTSLGT